MNKHAIINFIINNSDYTLEKAFRIPNSTPVDGEGTYDENGKQGAWEEYEEYGGNYVLISVVNYRDNKRDGYSEVYYENGQLASRGNYKDGKMDGYWETYHENGQLETKGNYRDNKREGEWEIYWPDGELESKRDYFRNEIVSYDE